MEGFFASPVWGAYIWRGLYMEGLIFGILRYLISCPNFSESRFPSAVKSSFLSRYFLRFPQYRTLIPLGNRFSQTLIQPPLYLTNDLCLHPANFWFLVTFYSNFYKTSVIRYSYLFKRTQKQKTLLASSIRGKRRREL